MHLVKWSVWRWMNGSAIAAPMWTSYRDFRMFTWYSMYTQSKFIFTFCLKPFCLFCCCLIFVSKSAMFQTIMPCVLFWAKINNAKTDGVLFEFLLSSPKNLVFTREFSYFILPWFLINLIHEKKNEIYIPSLFNQYIVQCDSIVNECSI